MPTSEFWDREVFERQHIEWMAIPAVRNYINRLIGNGELMWPIELLEKFLGGRTFERGLSIGCGAGDLERQLLQRGLCRTMDAFDGSTASLFTAKREAARAGLGDRVRYFAADFNEPALPDAVYDIVFFHQSAHHVGKLEKLYRAVMRTLKPGGIVYFDEYVGPSRFDWHFRPELLEQHRRIFNRIPRRLRAVEKLQAPIQVDDPSEAIRSSEIEPQLAVGFDILGRQPYGGAILSVILPNLRVELLDESFILGLIEEDRRAPAFYALIAAAPKRGLRGAVARARYWLEPKLKRVLVEARKLIRG